MDSKSLISLTQPTDAALFINGMYYDMEYADVFTILDVLKSEGKVLDGLDKLGLTDEQARKFVTLDLGEFRKESRA